jgi:hypothetical protein
VRPQQDGETCEVAVRRGAGVLEMACAGVASKGASDRVSAAGSLEAALMWAAPREAAYGHRAEC